MELCRQSLMLFLVATALLAPTLGSRTAHAAGGDALERAIVAGDRSSIERFISEGQIEATTREGITPIFIAAALGNYEIFELLSDSGARYDVTHPDGSNLLHAAVAGKNINIVRLVVAADVDVNAQNSEGDTPLHYGIRSFEPTIMDVLMQHGANIDIKNDLGETPRQLAAAIRVDLQAFATGSNDESGEPIDVHARDADGWTPLFWAARDNDLAMIEKLLELGADIHAEDVYGSTALFYAIYHERRKAAKLLILKGADVNAKSDEGETPLMAAASENNGALILLLLTLGADPTATDKAGKRAYDYFGRSATKEVRALLR